MAVQNRILKVQKRNRALVRFDQNLIRRAIRRAADSIGGFQHDLLPGINDTLFEARASDDAIADFLSDAVVVCLNSNPQHLIANFPPTIESIQDQVIHVLQSHGLQNTADAYACYRWGRHWLREGAIAPAQFAGNGVSRSDLELMLTWNRQRGCDTVAGLNERVRSGRLRELIEESLAVYESALDAAADKVISRLNAGDHLRMIWITGPSASGKTTTTVKLTRRLEQRGLRFLMLNLDDYFWPLLDHPTDWINDRNYEVPEALDIQMLNQHLRQLLDGRTIDKPVYDFKEGRCVATRPVRLEAGQLLLLDCLHGLYPPLTEGIDAAAQFRLYIEACNPVYEGDGSSRRLTWFTDVRLMRRMLRDARHRSHAPLRTILHWHYVRAGELFSIIPLRGLADHAINGGFPFDLPLLQPFFTGPSSLLPRTENFQSYGGFLDARIRFARIKNLIESVTGVTSRDIADASLIPGDALVREFIGGSILKIPHNE